MLWFDEKSISKWGHIKFLFISQTWILELGNCAQWTKISLEKWQKYLTIVQFEVGSIKWIPVFSIIFCLAFCQNTLWKDKAKRRVKCCKSWVQQHSLKRYPLRPPFPNSQKDQFLKKCEIFSKIHPSNGIGTLLGCQIQINAIGYNIWPLE